MSFIETIVKNVMLGTFPVYCDIALNQYHPQKLCGLVQFLDQWKSITSNRLVLSMVKGHYVQFRCHPLLFCNYKMIQH